MICGEKLKKARIISIDFATSLGMLVIIKASVTIIIVMMILKIINTINTFNLIQ
jgi:hypothetical protein